MGIKAKGGALLDDSTGQDVIYSGPVTVTPVSAKTQIAALVAVSTANATDLPTAQALANANKVAINAIIAALKA